MFSILIINKDDEQIKDTLESLVQTNVFRQAEVIVIDSSNHKLDWIKKQFPQVKWFAFKHSGPKKITIPEQRNLSLRKASGDILVFLDASCVPTAKNWLTNLTRPITKEGEKIVRGTLSNTDNYVSVTQQSGEKIYVTESPTINMAVARDVFDQIGGFDESFSYGSDMDFSWRATHHGYKIRYVQDAPVSHNFGDTGQNMKRYMRYGQARAKLYFNHAACSPPGLSALPHSGVPALSLAAQVDWKE